MTQASKDLVWFDLVKLAVLSGLGPFISFISDDWNPLFVSNPTPMITLTVSYVFLF